MPYAMKISNQVLKHLGIQLYDTIPAVLAEFISNSYDADAQRVDINFYDNQNNLTDEMFGKFLTFKKGDDKGYRIEIIDDGHGMTPAELDINFLTVGRNRRLTNHKKDSPLGRAVTGNKGIGKLAAFGVCKVVEIISSGGEKNTSKMGYDTGHVILEKDKMLGFEHEKDYEPIVGEQDATYKEKLGTKIILKHFEYKKVIEKEMLIKNLLSRFNQTILEKCKIYINQELVTLEDMPYLHETKLTFNNQNNQSTVEKHQGIVITDIKAYFECDNKKYPINGWVAYSADPIKIDSFLGIRILCKGKIATKTIDFNLPSGYTGEFNNKSYIMGELSADWLDEDDDMISTDRNSITWSNPICAEFQTWGQGVVKYISKNGRPSIQKKHQESFFKITNFEETLKKRYPNDDHFHIREKAKKIANMISRNMRKDDLEDQEVLKRYVDLSLFFAPHMELDDSFTDIAKEENISFEIMNQLIQQTNIADIAAYGRIAQKHIDVILKLESLTNDNTLENKLQSLLEKAPWLISPHSTPISQNSNLKNIRVQLENYLQKNNFYDKIKTDFPVEYQKKRPDFVFFFQDKVIEIIEIKKALGIFMDSDCKRLSNYIYAFREFIKNDSKSNEVELKVLLICDTVKLEDVTIQEQFDSFQSKEELKQISWGDFLTRAKDIHNEFLDEYEKLKSQETNV